MSWLSDIDSGGELFAFFENPMATLNATVFSNLFPDAPNQSTYEGNGDDLLALLQEQINLNAANTILLNQKNLEYAANAQTQLDKIAKLPDIQFQNTISGFNLTAMMQKFYQPPTRNNPTISG